MSARRAGRVILFGGLGALLLFVVVRVFASPLWQVTPADARAAQQELPVPGGDEKAPVVSGDFVAGEGIVEPIHRESRISAAVDGRIAAVHVTEGDHVEPGAILVVLDNQVESAAVTAADADVASARAQLARTAAGQRRQEVEAAIADTEVARARRARAGLPRAHDQALPDRQRHAGGARAGAVPSGDRRQGLRVGRRAQPSGGRGCARR